MRLGFCDRLLLRPLTGHWYRAVRLSHWKTRLSTIHSKTTWSRFSRATLNEPGSRILYLGENHQVVIYEVGAAFGDPGALISDPRSSWLILSLEVVLDHVADLSDPAQQKIIQTSHQELTGDWLAHPGVAPTQKLGPALFDLPQLEGFLFASSKLKGRNLVILPDKLGPRSSVDFHNELTGKIESLT